MRKKSIDKDVIVLLISTLLTVAVWVGLEVYRAYVKVTLPTGLEKYLKPISPTLKIDVLDRLERRVI